MEHPIHTPGMYNEHISISHMHIHNTGSSTAGTRARTTQRVGVGAPPHRI